MFCLCVCVCPWCLAACPGKVGAAGTATQTHSTHSQLWPCSAFTTWIERRDFEESISHKAGFTVGACDVMTWDVRVGGWCTVHLVWTPESREDAARPDVHCRLSNESQTVQTVFITTWGLMDYFHSMFFIYSSDVSQNDKSISQVPSTNSCFQEAHVVWQKRCSIYETKKRNSEQ